MGSVKFKSLNHKLLVSVIAVGVSFASIAAVISFCFEFDRSSGKTQTMVSQLIDTVEGTAAIAAYTSNQEIGNDVIHGLLRNDIVQKVRIISDHGLLLEKGRANPGKPEVEITRELISPFDSQQVIGKLGITPEGGFNIAEARHGALVNAINSFALISLTTIIILLIVRSDFSTPLTMVSNALHEVIAGKKNRLVPLQKNKNDELGQLVTDINGLLDVLENKFAEERSLRMQIETIEKQLREIFESTSAGLFLLDCEGRLLTSNPTMLKILGKQKSEEQAVIGQHFGSLFFDQPEKIRHMIQNAMLFEELEAQDLMLRPQDDGGHVWVHCLLSKIDDSLGNARIEGVVFDVSKRVATENAVRYEAEHDSLTGLLRRYPAELKLKKFLAHADAAVTVLMLDLDGFKLANDTYGHDIGDRVLVEITQRLTSCVRADDVIARLGGDEFLIVINHCEPKTKGVLIAEKILAAISAPIVVDSRVIVHVGVSIGIAGYPEHADNSEALVKFADAAMYEVKRNGKHGYGVKAMDGEVQIHLGKGRCQFGIADAGLALGQVSYDG